MSGAGTYGSENGLGQFGSGAGFNQGSTPTVEEIYGAGNYFDWDTQTSTINATAPSDTDPIDYIIDSGVNGVGMEQVGVSSRRPTYDASAGINGNPTMDFDGTNDNLIDDSKDLSTFNFMHDGSISWSAFVVFRIDDSSGATQAIISNTTSSSTIGVSISMNNATNKVNFYVGNGTQNVCTIASDNTITYGVDTFMVLGYNITTNNYQLYLGDVTLQEFTPTNEETASNHTFPLTFCARASGPTTLLMDGPIGQIVIGQNKAPSEVISDVRTLITGKWGV